jgi:hypothetical protein
MNKLRISFHALALVVFTLALTSMAQAQATRTWVSGVGDDVNPCSRTAPCKTFAGAISKTAAGGEINALDPGGFGTVTITKSLTIDGAGTMASILSAGSPAGVTVNDGATATPGTAIVALRNLSINGAGTGTHGVRFIAGSQLYVENCVIQNLTTFGIDGSPTTASGGAYLVVKNTIIDRAVGGGISIAPGAGAGVMRSTIDETQVAKGLFGIKATGNSRTAVNRTVVTSSTTDGGFLADGSLAEMNVEHSLSTMNQIGVRARNSALIRLSNTAVFVNVAQGLLPELGGQIHTFKNNAIAGNTPDGTPSLQLTPQ